MQNEVKSQIQVQQASDGEGAMARADLYRAAKNAMKLFQMVQEGQELEGWVQAKITKSADYLDSVYHYMEYQMKFGGGAQALSVDDITGEAEMGSAKAVSEEDDEKPIDMEESMNYEQRLQALLESAKQKAMMKKKPAKKDEKVEEGKVEVQYDKDGKRTGVKHTSTHKYTDEPHTEPKSQAKSKSAAEKAADKAADKAQSQDSKAYAKKNPGSVKTYKDGKLVSETNKGAAGAIDFDKVLDAIAALYGDDMWENDAMQDLANDLEQAGPTDQELDFIIAKGKLPKRLAGIQFSAGDNVQFGEGFPKKKKIAKIMDEAKTCNETAEGKSCPVHGTKKCPMKEGAKPDFLDMDKDGDKKEPMKKAVADKGGDKKDSNKGMSDKQAKYFGKKNESVEVAKEVVTESADLIRMKQFLTRLNG